jgi:hypothetical protein
MDTNTQTLLRLIAKAEVAKNRADEAQRVADIKARTAQALMHSQGVQSCMIQDCSMSARYVTTHNQFCANHAPATIAEMVAKR